MGCTLQKSCAKHPPLDEQGTDGGGGMFLSPTAAQPLPHRSPQSGAESNGHNPVAVVPTGPRQADAWGHFALRPPLWGPPDGWKGVNPTPHPPLQGAWPMGAVLRSARFPVTALQTPQPPGELRPQSTNSRFGPQSDIFSGKHRLV